MYNGKKMATTNELAVKGRGGKVGPMKTPNRVGLDETGNDIENSRAGFRDDSVQQLSDKHNAFKK